MYVYVYQNNIIYMSDNDDYLWTYDIKEYREEWSHFVYEDNQIVEYHKSKQIHNDLQKLENKERNLWEEMRYQYIISLLQ